MLKVIKKLIKYFFLYECHMQLRQVKKQKMKIQCILWIRLRHILCLRYLRHISNEELKEPNTKELQLIYISGIYFVDLIPNPTLTRCIYLTNIPILLICIYTKC